MVTRQPASVARSLQRSSCQTLLAKLTVFIAGDDALVLQREDQVKILAPKRHKGSPSFAGRLTESLIKLLDIVLTKKPIGLLQSMDLPRSQFRRQTSLPGAKTSFTAPARLW